MFYSLFIVLNRSLWKIDAYFYDNNIFEPVHFKNQVTSANKIWERRLFLNFINDPKDDNVNEFWRQRSIINKKSFIYFECFVIKNRLQFRLSREVLPIMQSYFSFNKIFQVMFIKYEPSEYKFKSKQEKDWRELK